MTLLQSNLVLLTFQHKEQTQNTMQLTNRQIEQAFFALTEFNPPKAPYKAKLRLSRNLRKLRAAFEDKEHERQRLCNSHVLDKSKAPAGPNGGVVLTPQEHLNFHPDHQKLLRETQNVELHPIALFDSRIGQKVEDPDHAIDLAAIEINSVALSALLDVVLIPVEDTPNA